MRVLLGLFATWLGLIVVPILLWEWFGKAGIVVPIGLLSLYVAFNFLRGLWLSITDKSDKGRVSPHGWNSWGGPW